MPLLMCIQEICLNNSVDWDLVRGDVKCLNWNAMISPSCPVSLLNEALLHVIWDRVLKRTIVVRTGDNPWFDNRCVWLTVQRTKHIECGVVVGRRLIGRSIGWLVVMLSWSMKMLNERSQSGVNHS